MNQKIYLFAVLFLCCLQSGCFAADDWKRVYLATYPRAGNHWMRHLIEDAAHVATSSVYIDMDEGETKHLPETFPWGAYTSPKGYAGNCRYPHKGELVVIKTHYPAFSRVPFDLQPSVKTIRIVRHPVDSFWSYHLYRDGKSAAPRIPHQFLQQLINTWRNFQEYWDKQENVMTIRYEDLYTDTFGTLKKILVELDYKVTDEDIARAIAINPKKGSLYKHVANFNAEDLALVEQNLGYLMVKYNYPLHSTKGPAKNTEQPKNQP